jgi:prevent-host-death family protein
MAQIIDIHDPAANLPELVERVGNGEEIVIERDGKPVAVLTPAPENAPKKQGRSLLGLFEGQFKMTDDFDDPVPGMEDYYK